MTTEDGRQSEDSIRACAIARSLESFENLIDEMQAIFGDSWGGLELDDALPVLSSKHAAQIEHVILALGPEDANDLNEIVQIIDRAKSSGQNVTLVTHNLSSNALHQLLRSGADDFLPYPLPKGSLAALLTPAQTAAAMPVEHAPDQHAPTMAEPVAPQSQPERLTEPPAQITPSPAAEPEPIALTDSAQAAPEGISPSRLSLQTPVSAEPEVPSTETPATRTENLQMTTDALRQKLDLAQAEYGTQAEAKARIDAEVAAAQENISQAVEDAQPRVEQELPEPARLDLKAAPEPDTPASPDPVPTPEASTPLAKSVTEKLASIAPISLSGLQRSAAASDEVKAEDGFDRLQAEPADTPEQPKVSDVQPLRKDPPQPSVAPVSEAPKMPEPVVQPAQQAPAEPPAAAPAQVAPAPVKGGKQGIVFPVYGTAGGVGASTFASNLAWEMHTIVEKEGRSACVIDLGLQYGSVATYLDVPRSDATMELLTNMAVADEQALQGSMKYHKDKLAVFPSPVDPVPLELIEPRDVGQLLDLATSVYDIVIVDLPNTLTSWTEVVLDRAKLFFAFTEMEMRSAQNALRFLRALKAEELPYEKVQFVINRAPKMTDLAGRSRIKRMSDSLNVEFRWLLPDGGKQVVAAGDQGATLATVAARNPLRKEIRKIAEKMAELSASDANVKASA